MTLREAHDHPWMTAGMAPIGEGLEPTPPPPIVCHMLVSRREVERGRCLSIGDWRLQGRGDVRCREAAVGRVWIATVSNVESYLYLELFFGFTSIESFCGDMIAKEGGDVFQSA